MAVQLTKADHVLSANCLVRNYSTDIYSTLAKRCQSKSVRVCLVCTSVFAAGSAFVAMKRKLFCMIIRPSRRGQSFDHSYQLAVIITVRQCLYRLHGGCLN